MALQVVMRGGTARLRVAEIAGIALVLSIAPLIIDGGSARAAVGDITEYPVPSAGVPEGIATGSDGNIWFAEFDSNKVANVTTSGVVTEYSIPSPGGNPFGIAAGPDGNLWFTEANSGKVAKVTTSGSFTEYSTPTSGGLSGIAAGPDGNLWFTEQLGNKLGRVTTSGTITEYPLPTPGSEPLLIASGPDGNMWFTEKSGNKVGKVTSSGAITEYAVPTAASQPWGITAGPDGNVWFAELSGLKIAKITTAGVITEYPVPSGGPNVITSGPDGNLWVAEAGANKIAMVTTAGAFTEYVIPTANSWPMGITTGPDGNVWFTEHNANKIARLTLKTLAPSTYTPVSPTRVLDTRASGQTLGAGGSLNLPLGGAFGVPVISTAVVMNVTVTDTSAASFLTVYPTGSSLPLASNLNWTAGETVANLVHVALGGAGAITIFNSAGSTDVVIDLEGYFAPPSGGTAGEFVPLSPNRITDTRPGSGWPNAGLTLAPGGSLDVHVTGVGGVPAIGVEAVVLNATVTNTTAAAFLTAYPKGSTLPLASNLNWVAGATVPNRLVIPVGAGGVVSFYNSDGSTDLVVDVNGYFTDSTASGSSFVPLTPARILDTRDGTGGFSSPVGQGAFIPVTVAGRSGVPPMSAAAPPTAVVLNVTATDPTAAGFLIVWPDLLAQSPASDLNFVAGQTVPNLVVVKVAADGKVDVYNGWGSTDVIFDIVGWYG